MNERPKTEQNPKGAGRTVLEIDWERIDRLLEAGCTGARAAAQLGVHADTLYRAVEREKGLKFADYAAEKHAKGEGLLCVKQFQEAMKGDRGMLIWLGKQRLDQKENRDLKVEHTGIPPSQVINYGENSNPQPYHPSPETQQP